MTINVRTLAAGAALLLAPAFAQAQDSVAYPRDFGTPAHQAQQSHNVLGGGDSRLVDTGEGARVEYTGPVRSQAPIFAHIVGSAEDARIIYSASPDRATALSEAERAPRGQRG